jgi:inward rectifier potassium channel
MAKKPPPQELGFGKYISTTGRMLEPHGKFNVERAGLSVSKNLYFELITMPWPKFLAIVFGVYILLNIVFATAYTLLCTQLTGVEHLSGMDRWFESFFFSTQTLTTVGYGRVAPVGLAANFLASFESFIGLLGFALISGLLYGRFSRPEANIAFSRNLLVAPFQNGQALMFRIANRSKSELINAEVQVLIAFNETEDDGKQVRVFRSLPLQLNTVMFFTFSWTLVHPINEDSLVHGWSAQDFQERNPEFFILVKALEEANQQVVHARYSYIHEDIVWNARFKAAVGRNAKGYPLVMLDMLNAHEPHSGF